MKNIVKIFAGAALVALLASCDMVGNGKKIKYVTEDFVRFEESSYTVKEDCGSIKVPVSLYAKSANSCEVAVKAINGTAVQGKDFQIAKTTVSVSSILPSDTLEVTIISRKGELTGNLTFTLQLEAISGSDVKRGATYQCAITIKDVDGPTAPILGDYQVTGKDAFGTSYQWLATWIVDEADPYKIYIDYPTAWAINYASWGSWRIYGNVSKDLKTITFPLGQLAGDGTEEPAYWSDEAGDFYLASYSVAGGSIVPSLDGELKFVWDEAQEAYISDVAYGLASANFAEDYGTYNFKMMWFRKGLVWKLK